MNSFYFLLWKRFFFFFFDTLRILIHLHTPKCQFPWLQLVSASSSLPGELNGTDFALLFHSSKADFFFFFLLKQPSLELGLWATGWICTPSHTRTTTRGSPEHTILPIWIMLKTKPPPLYSCKCTISDVLQPCIRQKLDLNSQVYFKKQQNSTRADWIKINSFKIH